MKEIYLDPNFFKEDYVSHNIEVYYKGKKIESRIAAMKLIVNDSKDDFTISELLKDYAKNRVIIMKEIN